MNRAKMPRGVFLAGSSAVLAACHSADRVYPGMIENSWSAFYLDPNDFLSLFASADWRPS